MQRVTLPPVTGKQGARKVTPAAKKTTVRKKKAAVLVTPNLPVTPLSEREKRAGNKHKSNTLTPTHSTQTRTTTQHDNKAKITPPHMNRRSQKPGTTLVVGATNQTSDNTTDSDTDFSSPRTLFAPARDHDPVSTGPGVETSVEVALQAGGPPPTSPPSKTTLPSPTRTHDDVGRLVTSLTVSPNFVQGASPARPRPHPKNKNSVGLAQANEFLGGPGATLTSPLSSAAGLQPTLPAFFASNDAGKPDTAGRSQPL